MGMPKMTTPLGIALIAFFYGLLGLLCLLGWGAASQLAVASDLIPLARDFLFILAFIYLLLSYSLWTGKAWGFYIFMFMQAISFLLAFSSQNLLGLAISGLLLWYFYSHRTWFGI